MAQNKTVIKVLNEEHGIKVIQWLESQGIKNPLNLAGNAVASYYGDSEYGINSWRRLPEGYVEIQLPTELPKRGDRIFVWDDNEDDGDERIFITYIDGAISPVITVHYDFEEEFSKNKKYETNSWDNYKLITPKESIIELTMNEVLEKIAKLENVDVSRLRIKK